MDKQTPEVRHPGWVKWPAHPAEKCGPYASEPARVAADLARNAAKNSGALLREEVDRAHRAEVAAGVHSHA